MSKRKGYALATRSYYVDEPDALQISQQGSLYTIGCSTARGEIVQIEMAGEVAHMLWVFLASSQAGKRCDQCEPEADGRPIGHWFMRTDGSMPAADCTDLGLFGSLAEAAKYAEGRPLRVVAIHEVEGASDE